MYTFADKNSLFFCQSACEAAAKGDITHLKAQPSSSLLQRDEKGYLPIHYAAENDQLEILDYLLQQQPALVHATLFDWSACAFLVCDQKEEKLLAFLAEQGFTTAFVLQQNIIRLFHQGTFIIPSLLPEKYHTIKTCILKITQKGYSKHTISYNTLQAKEAALLMEVTGDSICPGLSLLHLALRKENPSQELLHVLFTKISRIPRDCLALIASHPHTILPLALQKFDFTLDELAKIVCVMIQARNDIHHFLHTYSFSPSQLTSFLWEVIEHHNLQHAVTLISYLLSKGATLCNSTLNNKLQTWTKDILRSNITHLIALGANPDIAYALLKDNSDEEDYLQAQLAIAFAQKLKKKLHLGSIPIIDICHLYITPDDSLSTYTLQLITPYSQDAILQIQYNKSNSVPTLEELSPLSLATIHAKTLRSLYAAIHQIRSGLLPSFPLPLLEEKTLCGWTLYQWAHYYGRKEAMKYLIKQRKAQLQQTLEYCIKQQYCLEPEDPCPFLEQLQLKRQENDSFSLLFFSQDQAQILLKKATTQTLLTLPIADILPAAGELWECGYELLLSTKEEVQQILQKTPLSPSLINVIFRKAYQDYGSSMISRKPTYLTQDNCEQKFYYFLHESRTITTRSLQYLVVKHLLRKEAYDDIEAQEMVTSVRECYKPKDIFTLIQENFTKLTFDRVHSALKLASATHSSRRKVLLSPQSWVQDMLDFLLDKNQGSYKKTGFKCLLLSLAMDIVVYDDTEAICLISTVRKFLLQMPKEQQPSAVDMFAL